MNKAEIVQDLLEKKHITAEMAVVLLTNENTNGITFIPTHQNPYYTYHSDWTGNPIAPYCGPTSDTTMTGSNGTTDITVTERHIKPKKIHLDKYGIPIKKSDGEDTH